MRDHPSVTRVLAPFVLALIAVVVTGCEFVVQGSSLETKPSDSATVATKAMSTHIYTDPREVITMPIPEGWSARSQEDYGVLTAPDGQVEVYALVALGEDIQETAACAADRLPFPLEVIEVTDMPNRGMAIITYDADGTPATAYCIGHLGRVFTLLVRGHSVAQERHARHTQAILAGFRINGRERREPAPSTVQEAPKRPKKVVSPTLCVDVAQIPQQECRALVALYKSTDGDSWVNNDGWLETLSPSQWHGVTVADGHVTELYLPENGLQGHIPSEIGDLTDLRGLDLTGSRLDGPLPHTLGRLSQLQVLALSYSQVSGAVPESLGDLSDLQVLRLNGNQLTGSIPAELGGPSKLGELHLAYNRLDGEIPTTLGDLADLEELLQHGNKLSGEIPSSLGRLTKLRCLGLSHNELSGAVPEALGQIPDLERLYLHGNKFSEEVEAEPAGGDLPNSAP